MVPAKNLRFLRFIHQHNKNFFRRVFSEYTEEIATSLIPFFLRFVLLSLVVWTKTTSLACDGVLADAISISPRPSLLSTNIRKVRGPRKMYGSQ